MYQDILMMKEINDARLVEFVDFNFDEISKYVDSLPLEQKAELAKKVLGNNPGVVIIGGNNMISNSNVLQLNGSAEEISKQLSNLSPEVFEELVRAIALNIKKENDRSE